LVAPTAVAAAAAAALAGGAVAGAVARVLGAMLAVVLGVSRTAALGRCCLLGEHRLLALLCRRGLVGDRRFCVRLGDRSGHDTRCGSGTTRRALPRRGILSSICRCGLCRLD